MVKNKKNTFRYTAGMWNLLCPREYHWVFWEKTIFSMKINELKINIKKTKINILPSSNRTLQLHHAAETGMGANLIFYRDFSIVSSNYVWNILNFFLVIFYQGNYISMNQIFEGIPNPNAQDSNGQAPIHIASEKGKFNQNLQWDFSNVKIFNEIFRIMSK